MALNSFGVAIPVTGPNNGFPGSVTRMGDRQIMAKPVDASASAAGIPFGAPVIEKPGTTGGTFLSVADYIAAAATNIALVQQNFVGIAVRNVQTQYAYTSLYASTGTTVVSTTATQATVGATTIVVALATNITVGMAVEGAGIASGTLVTGISGTTITISLGTLAAIPALTAVQFTQTLAAGVIGAYVANQQAEPLIDGSILVAITNGVTPSSNTAVYIRALANANLPGTSVGDCEGTDDVATTTPTTSTTVGSTTLTTSTGTGVAIGQRVTAPGIPANTYITAGSSTTWTISNAATATTTTQAASFSNMILLGDSVNPWIRFRTGNPDQNDVFEVTILARHAA
jgi:hypothetical protein